MDGLALSALVAELNTKLIGARVEKIFQTDKSTLFFHLRQPGQNLKMVMSAAPDHPRIYITTTVLDTPASPPSFCMLLRKHLDDGRVAQIVQQGADRIVTVDFDVRGEHGMIVTKSLIIELMGKHSNIVFVEKNLVIDAIKRVGPGVSRYRQVLPGKPYVRPPKQDRLNPFIASADEFSARLIKEADSLLGKAVINTVAGIGPVTAREIAWRAGFSVEATVTGLDVQDMRKLQDAFASLIQPLKQGHIEPTVVISRENKVLGIAPFKLFHLSGNNAHFFSSMSQAVEYVAGLSDARPWPEKDELKKYVDGEIAKLRRKLDILREELAEAAEAERFRQSADILMSNLHLFSNGAEEILLPDIFSADPDRNHVRIAIDPELSLLENARRYYERYSKLKRAQQTVATQLDQCIQDTAYLESIATALDNADRAEDLAEIRQEMLDAGYLKQREKRRPAAKIPAPLTFRTPDGTILLVGKNNRQNDYLTFKIAGPDDLWFHVKDFPGSHVILRSQGGGDAAPEDIRRAAGLAAYFSKARESSNVPVDFTRRKYVKKPAGSKPGFVIYERFNTIYVMPDKGLVEEITGVKKAGKE